MARLWGHWALKLWRTGASSRTPTDVLPSRLQRPRANSPGGIVRQLMFARSGTGGGFGVTGQKTGMIFVKEGAHVSHALGWGRSECCASLQGTSNVSCSHAQRRRQGASTLPSLPPARRLSMSTTSWRWLREGRTTELLGTVLITPRMAWGASSLILTTTMWRWSTGPDWCHHARTGHWRKRSASTAARRPKLLGSVAACTEHTWQY